MPRPEPARLFAGSQADAAPRLPHPGIVEDIRALIDASGAQRVHLVGHDWGAAAAWAAAAELSDRIATLTALSVPHPGAFLKALVTSRQGLLSWYMYVFQLPWLPEKAALGRSTTGKTGRTLSKFLQNGGQSPEAADRDAQAMADDGVLTAALNWYRAIPLTNLRTTGRKISVPTLYVWSDRDIALAEKPARDTARYVTGDYRFEILHGVTHWILDECPDKAADLLLEWFETHPI